MSYPSFKYAVPLGNNVYYVKDGWGSDLNLKAFLSELEKAGYIALSVSVVRLGRKRCITYICIGLSCPVE